MDKETQKMLEEHIRSAIKEMDLENEETSEESSVIFKQWQKMIKKIFRRDHVPEETIKSFFEADDEFQKNFFSDLSISYNTFYGIIREAFEKFFKEFSKQQIKH